MITVFILACACLLCTLSGCSPDKAVTADARRQSFDQGWLFRLGDDSLSAHTDYVDAHWRALDVPHDWAIEGTFSPDHPSGTGGGALPGGIGWYRKHFTVNPADADRRFYIDFDGVYMNSTVYINGHCLGTRPYGYISFSYDLTPYLRWGEDNVLAVRVDNAEQPNSRWYSGCGIYRHVWLRKLGPIHVAQWGTYVTAEDVSIHAAKLQVRTTLQYDSVPLHDSVAGVSLRTSLLDAKGHPVVRYQSDTVISRGTRVEIQHMLHVEHPHLWQLSDPYLYTVQSDILDVKTGMLLDSYRTTTGIRTFRFDAREGFILNGNPVKINGVCLHHDLGCLGAAVHVRAIERQLEILQQMGCNGIRCAHNPPAPELLDLCDRMGFIVMNEPFDMWRKKKTSHDYARYFDQWHERDLTDLLLRDRNHPSIFMWSIGNEVLEQWSDARADTLSLEEANLLLNFGHSADQLAQGDELSVNSLLARKLADHVRQLDSTRPITAGCNEPHPKNHLFRSGALDIIGFNYHDDWFAGVPERFPGKPFLVTESVSALMTRGYYRMPSDSVVLCPERWDKPYYDASFSCSSYDNCHVPWGNRHEGTLKHVKFNPFISGQYIWTGFDYLGEPTPYGWPARSSYFGIIDLAGFPKDVYYLYQSEWRPDLNVLHLFPHWNWTEGQEIDIWAYYNQADEVELYLNGQSQGIRRKGPADFHVQWRLRFTPGTLLAVSRKDGKVVARREIHTAGSPAAIRLTADRTQLRAQGTDLSYITVEIVDERGNLCPWATNQVHFQVSGPGALAGVDNGSPTSLESFKAPHRHAFYGKCLAVLQSSGVSGTISLTATSGGLETATVQINVKP